MELSNRNTLKLNTKIAGLALAGLLPLAAHAHDNWHRGAAANVSGEVQVTHQVPGGVITVGAEWGHRPQPQPQVVVVQDRRPDVVVVKEDRWEHGRGRGWGRAHKHAREVTIIREEPRREVTIIKHEEPRKVVVVQNQPSCDRRDDGYTRSHEWSDGRAVSVDRQGPSGNYHYYEDDHQVSIDDNRDGRQRHVYVRK